MIRLKIITIHSHIPGSICPRPALEKINRFQDSSFTVLASLGGRSTADARISGGSAWCALVYLQVDLGRLYVIDHVAIFGDSAKWVTTYNMNYTADLMNYLLEEIRRNGNFSKFYFQTFYMISSKFGQIKISLLYI